MKLVFMYLFSITYINCAVFFQPIRLEQSIRPQLPPRNQGSRINRNRLQFLQAHDFGFTQRDLQNNPIVVPENNRRRHTERLPREAMGRSLHRRATAIRDATQEVNAGNWRQRNEPDWGQDDLPNWGF